jgi:hypothetical protein
VVRFPQSETERKPLRVDSRTFSASQECRFGGFFCTYPFSIKSSEPDQTSSETLRTSNSKQIFSRLSPLPLASSPLGLSPRKNNKTRSSLTHHQLHTARKSTGVNGSRREAPRKKLAQGRPSPPYESALILTGNMRVGQKRLYIRDSRFDTRCPLQATRCTLHATCYMLYETRNTLHATRYTLHATRYTLHATR